MSEAIVSTADAGHAHDESSNRGMLSADVRPGNLYFIAAGAWYTLVSIVQLAVGRFDPEVNLAKMARGALMRHIHGQLDEIHQETGHCYTCRVPRGLLSDAEATSRLVIYEDGTALGPAHSSHNDIRTHGGGRYSHWTGWLYFSTPDYTDPRTNGRAYTYRD